VICIERKYRFSPSKKKPGYRTAISHEGSNFGFGPVAIFLWFPEKIAIRLNKKNQGFIDPDRFFSRNHIPMKI
jgi:hypothetical protein